MLKSDHLYSGTGLIKPPPELLPASSGVTTFIIHGLSCLNTVCTPDVLSHWAMCERRVTFQSGI